MGPFVHGTSPNISVSLRIHTCALTFAIQMGQKDRPLNEHHIAAVWQLYVEEKCFSFFLSYIRFSSYQNTESMICPQELFKTNLVVLDEVPLSLAGPKTLPVLAAAEILRINWILFFPGQSSTALFMQ